MTRSLHDKIGFLQLGCRRYGYTRDDVPALIDAALRAMEACAVRESGPFTSPEEARTYARLRLADQPSEVFACFFLDSKHRLIEFRELFRGTIDGASVHPREVARVALELNAGAVILCHNHPSGDPEPSAADVAITHRLRRALELIDVRVLDHVVVGAEGAVSLAERGVI